MQEAAHKRCLRGNKQVAEWSAHFKEYALMFKNTAGSIKRTRLLLTESLLAHKAVACKLDPNKALINTTIPTKISGTKPTQHDEQSWTRKKNVGVDNRLYIVKFK